MSLAVILPTFEEELRHGKDHGVVRETRSNEYEF